MKHTTTKASSFILILSALAEEIIPLLHHMRTPQDPKRPFLTESMYFATPTLLAYSGMGVSATRQFLQKLVVQYHISSIILWGSAASLREDIHIGDLCVAHFVRNESAPFLWPCHEAFANTLLSQAQACFPRIHHSEFLCVDAPVYAPSAIAKRLRATCEVLDMESWALAEFAGERGIPFGITKIISDKVGIPSSTSPSFLMQRYAAQYLSLLNSVLS